MTPAAPTSNERERLAALERHEVLDTAPEAEFDDLTSLAAQICGTPIALISLVDAHRQWFKSKVGFDAAETSRDVSFCGHAIHGRHVMEVPDALGDFIFHDNPLVTGEPEIRFYAGMPLATSDGQNLGTLCVMDRVPRQLTTAQREALGRLGRQVMNQMELRLTNRRLAAANQELQELEERSRLVVEAAPNAMVMVDDQGRMTLVNFHTERLFGYSRAELIGQPVEMLVPERYRKTNPKDIAGFFSALKPRITGKSRNLTGRRKDGTEVPIEIGLNPKPAPAGRFMLASIIERTARKRTGHQVNRLKHNLKTQARQLELTKRELTDLTSLVSRDLKGPLRGIGSFANRLVTAYANRLDGSGREQLNLLALKVRRLNALIDGILTTSPASRSREENADPALEVAEMSASEKIPATGNGCIGSRNQVHRSSPKVGCGLEYSAERDRLSVSDWKSSVPVGTDVVTV